MNRSPAVIIVGLFLLVLMLNWSRFALDNGEPVFLLEPVGVWIELGRGFPRSEVSRQFIDECRLGDVIRLTEYPLASDVLVEYSMDMLLESGRRVDVIVQGFEIQSISISWMSAAKRVVLGVPLHPDRMTQMDWEYLPGLGEKMAARIEIDRQNNGDFILFDRLLRVKGVGSSKLAVWKDFF